VRLAGPGRSRIVSGANVPSLVRGIRRGLTQEQLAREIGVTFSTVNGWENGKHQPIRAFVNRLLDIAAAAGLQAGEGRQRSARQSRVARRLRR